MNIRVRVDHSQSTSKVCILAILVQTYFYRNIVLLEATKSLKVTAEFVKDEIEPQYSFEDVGICTRYDVTSISQ